MKNSNLFLVSAPSGTGKSSLINSVLDRADKSKFPLELSISYTTRKPRVGETDSNHYFFISPEEFAEKLTKEYKRFWNDGRLAKAKALNLTPAQVYTLASIVHKETAKADERPKVAGVYLNRLNKNMPLQADPTVIFALKQKSNDWKAVNNKINELFKSDLDKKGKDKIVKEIKDFQIETAYNHIKLEYFSLLKKLFFVSLLKFVFRFPQKRKKIS